MRNHTATHAKPGRNRLRNLAWLTLLTAAVLTALPAGARGQEVSMEAVEAAILEEDWEEVVKLLKSVTDDPQKSPDPVLRLIKGHACLAENDNDESYCLFLSVVVPEDLERCRTWADGFARNKDNRNPAVSYYFLGDVLARLGRFDEALKAFNEADRRHPNHPLILNARGVAHAAQGNVDGALSDVDRAAELPGSSLADAYANLGALAIQQKEGAQEALKDFDRAIEASGKASRRFSLARYGRGCIWSVLGEVQKGREDMEKARAGFGCGAGELDANLSVAYERIIAAQAEGVGTALASSGQNPQARIDAEIRALERGASPTGFLGRGPGSPVNRIFDEYRKSGYDPQVWGYAKQQLTDYARNNPDKAPGLMTQTARVFGTNNLGRMIRDAFPKVETITRTDEVTLGGRGGLSGTYAGGAAVGGPPGGALGGGFGKYDLSGGGSFTSRSTQHMKPGKLPLTVQHERFAEGARELQSALGQATGIPSQPQGFRTAPEHAAWDDGDWPFPPMYGLLYVSSWKPAPSASEGAGQ